MSKDPSNVKKSVVKKTKNKKQSTSSNQNTKETLSIKYVRLYCSRVDAMNTFRH